MPNLLALLIVRDKPNRGCSSYSEPSSEEALTLSSTTIINPILNHLHEHERKPTYQNSYY